MAETAPVFRILRDSTTGAGESPVSRIEGEAAASQEGSIGFAFKDSSGNVVLPSLTATGAISVDTGSAGTPKQAAAEATTITALNTEQDILTISLTSSKLHSCKDLSGSSFQPCKWRLYWVDDVGGTPTETDLAAFVTGPGDANFATVLDCISFTTTANAAELRLACTQLRGPLGDVHAFTCAIEAP